MNGFFKLTDEGIQRANAIYSSDFTLTPENNSESYDGWKWFENPEEAILFFAGKIALTGSPIEQGERFVVNAGFSADRKVTLLDLLLQAKEANALESKPKLVALYTWLQTVKATALAGSTVFPEAPCTFEEVVGE